MSGAVEPVGWGVLGPGGVAQQAVIPAIQASGAGRVVAVASRDRGRAADVAARFGVPRAYGEYAALLADPAVEAVYVALPNHLHVPWTAAAARAGKHVRCEKPLAPSAAAAAQAVVACEAAGVLLMEAAMYRFHPRMVRLHQLVREGLLGTPRLIHAAFGFPLAAGDNYRLRPEMGGGALLDVGLYVVSAARWLAGAEPRSVLARAESWPPHGVDRLVAGLLEFSNGVLATVQCSFDSAEHQLLEVVGRAGVSRAPRAFTAWRGEAAPLYWRAADGEEREEVFEADPYAVMVEHFSRCVRGLELPRFSARDAEANLRTLDALARAAISGRAERPEVEASS